MTRSTAQRPGREGGSDAVIAKYIRLGSIQSKEEVIAVSQRLEPLYKMAKWRWGGPGDRVIPSANLIAETIRALVRDCPENDSLASGGLCVFNTGGRMTIAVDPQLMRMEKEDRT